MGIGGENFVVVFDILLSLRDFFAFLKRYAVGARKAHHNGIPASSKSVQIVELWVKSTKTLQGTAPA